MKSLPSPRTMHRAVDTRDREWDGLFIVALRTTGIACRPVCPSRLARPENRVFFATLDDARAAGFRPCRRCRPEQHHDEPSWVAPLTAIASDPRGGRLTDADLAAQGFDPVQVRRHFRRRHGTTFHAWVRAQRVATAQRRLADGASVDHVVLESGYESHSGFRDAFERLVGTSPGRARGGEPVIATAWESPIGPLVAAAVDEGLCLLEFGDLARLERQTPQLQRWFKGPIVAGEHRYLTQVRRELDEYFAGARTAFDVPLVRRGTPFELSVWKALSDIPFGETRSYIDIARLLGQPDGARAVGTANGRNRLAIIIPCHRVLNANGQLGGYGGGLWRKVRLLELEGALPPRLV